MRKGREILSLPVMDTSTGVQLGDVREIIYDWSEGRIHALVLQDGGWISGSKILLWDDISNVGPDAVTVENKELILDTKKDERARELWTNKKAIFGTKVLTDTGEDLGTVEDMVIDCDSGCITGYELSGGPVEDLLKGRRVLPYGPEVAGNEDVLVVSSKEVSI